MVQVVVIEKSIFAQLKKFQRKVNENKASFGMEHIGFLNTGKFQVLEI